MVDFSLNRALALRSESELVDLHDRWVGGSPPARRADLVQSLRSRMQDPAAVSMLCGSLYGDLAPVFRAVSGAESGSVGLAEVRCSVRGLGVPERRLRGALMDLVALGLLVPAAGANGHGERWGVPEEIRAILDRGPGHGDELHGMLTLRGWLQRWYERRTPGADVAAQVRKMYRLLTDDAAILARVDGLEEEHRAVLHAVAVEHGGILPMRQLEEVAPEVHRKKLRAALEGASVGTVCELDLERSGIRHRGRALVLFHEVTLAYLKRQAGRDPIAPREVASIGVDFVSNFSRFASFVDGDTVRFTVRGTIYRSTGKRIADQLLPNPGREFRRTEILELEYRFALDHGYIDRTGRRSFRLTPAGQEFLGLSLLEKQRRMLDWLIEDRNLPGDMAQQLRLRRVTLRYVKRLEPGVWYDAMFLPFVARSHHLCTLPATGANGAAGNFPVRSSADLRSLAWNLFLWIRKHLYLLGVVDMGYDEDRRAVAIRVTQLGAELLDMIPGRELEGGGHVVVNPDFEVVLFPDQRSHGLIYALDRFCEREFTDSLYHYRITPGSLHRALAEGVQLDEILDLLRERSRTPLPQNVCYSLESWARKDGMVTVRDDGLLECEHVEVLDRLVRHPEIEKLGIERVDPRTARLPGGVDRDRIAGWVRDFGVGVRFRDVSA